MGDRFAERPLSAGFGGVIMLAAAGQFLLLLLFYSGLYRHRGWVRLFGWVYLL